MRSELTQAERDFLHEVRFAVLEDNGGVSVVPYPPGATRP